MRVVALALAALAVSGCTRTTTSTPDPGGTAAPEVSDPTGPPADGTRCPRFSGGERVGQVSDPDLAEVSGLAASRANPGLLWVQEDSGNPPDLVAVRPDGTVARKFRLTGVTARDWEDVAVGPGPDTAATYVYLGDIGDNTADQSSFHVVRVREPNVAAGDAAGTRIELGGAVALTGRYPEGPHDAEALLSDPRTGDLFVVTKSEKGRSRLYRWPAPQSPSATTTLEAAGTIDVNALDGAIDRRVTAGDVSPDGSEILLRTYTNAWLWRRGPGESVADALATQPCPVPLELERQGEAIGWDSAAAAYYSTTEGSRPPIVRYDRE